MRSTQEVVDHIDKLMRAMLDRPKMYASNPESLEDLLCYLDRLRDFATEERKLVDREQGFDGYTTFLVSRGFGSANFCHRKRRRKKRLTEEDLRLFEQLAQFWREYLEAAAAPQSSS